MSPPASCRHPRGARADCEHQLARAWKGAGYVSTFRGDSVRGSIATLAGTTSSPRRLISDNAWTYTRNKALARLLARRGIRHLLIPYRPQVNGKVERYQQTLKREWARGQVYRSSEHRAQALSHWGQLLQRAQTPQLARRPITDQPRPQRPEAGHLGASVELRRA